MYSADELIKLYHSDFSSLLSHASQFIKNGIEFCSLINARNGKCSQDCKYCAQSVHYQTAINSFPLVEQETVIRSAKEARAHHASRFAIVTSGKTPDEGRDFDRKLDMIRAINQVPMKSCASLGILTEQQAKALADAGLTRYHHNINTSCSYYSEICTTHTFGDRINTCKLVRKYGMELCCGVILGMGETVEQRIEMALNLADIQPDSIPINILMPIPGTPMANYHNRIDEEHVLRTLAIFKIVNPGAILRFCGGRMRLSLKNQELALKTCVEGMMVGNYLTTVGCDPYDDLAMVKRLGKKLS